MKSLLKSNVLKSLKSIDEMGYQMPLECIERKGDITRAVILSSLSWALIHANPYWAVQIFIMGIIIGFLAWRTNSIFPGIIVHVVNNLMSLIFINSEMDSVIDWYLTGNHVNPIILLPSIIILVWCIRKISFIYANDTL